MKDKLTKVKNHIAKHRIAYGVGAAITGVTVLVVKRAQEWNEFAIEEGVYDAYTTAEVAAE
jgi:phosphate starvation-inducible protein PhoH